MPENRPLISVIMNCYNGEEFLKEAIDSVVNQSYPNWEVIFWDNQSKDKSAQIIKSYHDDRIKYYYAEKFTGLGEARNYAISKSKGEWIAFLDVDDFWSVDKLELQMQRVYSEKFPEKVGLVYTRTEKVFGNGRTSPLQEKFSGVDLPEGLVLEKLLLINNFIPLVSAVIRKAAFDKVGGIPSEFVQSEDYYMFAGICSEWSCVAVQETKSFYRIHSNNLSHTQLERASEESIKILQKWGAGINILKKVREYKTVLAAMNFKKGKISLGLKMLFIEGSLLFLIKGTFIIFKEKFLKKNHGFYS